MPESSSEVSPRNSLSELFDLCCRINESELDSLPSEYAGQFNSPLDNKRRQLLKLRRELRRELLRLIPVAIRAGIQAGYTAETSERRIVAAKEAALAVLEWERSIPHSVRDSDDLEEFVCQFTDILNDAARDLSLMLPAIPKYQVSSHLEPTLIDPDLFERTGSGNLNLPKSNRSSMSANSAGKSGTLKRNRRQRANKRETQGKVMAAILHKIDNPEATEKECAQKAKIPQSTLHGNGEWKDWLPKIEKASSGGKIESLKVAWDKRIGEYAVHEKSDS